MFAYIPARGGSKRVPRKNIYQIEGKPLLSHVIEHLKGVSGLTGIAVSSEDEEIINVAGKNGAVTLEKRSEHLAKDMTTFMDLVNEDIERFAEHFNDRDVLFVLPTSILVTADYFNKAMETYYAHKRGLVISVAPANPSPLLSFMETESGELNPLFPEMFAKPTKDLPFTCVDSGNFYAFNLTDMKFKKMFIDLKPIHSVILPRDVGVDVDSMDDINTLKKILEAKK
jgi:CMP-N,N'-diacetyllegionaminic acid synthase